MRCELATDLQLAGPRLPLSLLLIAGCVCDVGLVSWIRREGFKGIMLDGSDSSFAFAFASCLSFELDLKRSHFYIQVNSPQRALSPLFRRCRSRLIQSTPNYRHGLEEVRQERLEG